MIQIIELIIVYLVLTSWLTWIIASGVMFLLSFMFSVNFRAVLSLAFTLLLFALIRSI